MAKVELTKHLFTFFPQLEGRALDVDASTVAEVVQVLERIAPGFAFYVCDERGRLRMRVSWEDLRDGLPQENAYDVVYRHALDNDHGGLAFGSTTGNLYVSEDRGDRWTCVANDLPPIYSVRFG